VIPITKNVQVVDESGNEYGATYPKRAKGLVKNGRARFVTQGKICLARPPNINLEENKVEDVKVNEAPAVTLEFSMEYILAQIDKITSQTEHIYEALITLGNMDNGENAECGSPGNTLGQAKAQAIAEVVKQRENTNQLLLRFFERMYDDFKPNVQSIQKKAMDLLVTAVNVRCGASAYSKIHEALEIIQKMNNKN